MKWLWLGLILLPTLFLIGMEVEDQSQLKTVEELDIDKYLGEWYAVASIPRFFNRSCAWGNKAEYRLRDDGRIDVLNTCYTEEGKKREVRAVGWVPDRLEPGKLKVSFLPLFGYRLFAADYWVLEVGDDYEYAVVGHPNRNFGWILSRKPELEPETLEAIADRLEGMGYDFSDFEMNPQAPPEKG
ncbi:MAG: lipocalin family protein [Candidatus Bipolaricaulota bacterium]